MLRRSSRLLVPFLLVLVVACGGGPLEEEPAPPAHLPRVSTTALRFSWDRADIVATSGERSVDIASQRTEFTLHAPSPREATIGLFAVDPLEAPALDGMILLSRMPTESALTVAPDGAATFTYWDLFDPRWRGRQPEWRRLDLEEGPVDVDSVRDDPLPPKVARDADPTAAGEMLFARDNEGQIHFYWSGDLRYCFDFGREVLSLSLADPTGEYRTTFQALPGFEIRLSADGEEWLTVWRSEEEGVVQPEVELPAALQGARSLCIALGGAPDEFYTIQRLYLTVRLQASDLVDLTRFPQGERLLTYTDGPASSHRAIFFWSDPRIAAPRAEVEYPTDAPVVEALGDLLRVRFPAGALVEFPLSPSGAPGGVHRLVIGQQTVFQAPPGAGWSPPAVLTLLDGQPVPLPEDFDWAAYRQAFLDSGTWPSRWERAHRSLSLDRARFDGAWVEGDEVVLRWSVPTTAGEGRVEWILSSEKTEWAGMEMVGVGMRWRVEGAGLVSAERIAFTLPLLMSPGDWQIEQFFRHLAEDPFTFQASPGYPQAVWFGESQSFVFRSGPGRTVLGLFESPVWASVRVNPEAGRHVYTFDVPLGAGEVRQTPRLLWFTAPLGAATRWAAVDAWARLYEEVKTAYSEQAGVVVSPPLPTVVWNLPLEEEFFATLERFVETGEYPEPGEGWFDRFAQAQLERAEAAGVQNIIIQAPWTSDAEDPNLISSFHAPRDFHVSDMLGGREGLKRLVEEAHRRGIQVTLWYPSAFSLFSPLVEKHPEWVAWEMTGVPEDGGWGDIVGLDTRTAYREYAVEALADLRREVPFDGIWMDSWVGLAVLTDYSDAQPAPQLETAIELQRAFTEMGVSQLIIEGLGPLGRPDAYGDYESYAGPPDPLPEQVAELERLRGHEYLLYRIGAGAYLDVEVYYRALASGGLLNIANLDEVDSLNDGDRNRLRQVNLDYRQVLDRMQYRRLVVSGDRWLGVAWTRAGSPDVVLFAFESFTLQATGPLTVEDVTTGERFEVEGEFEVEPYHAYVLYGVD